MATVTCHTPDCGNADVPIEMTLSGTDPDTGESWSVSAVSCGACGQPITDVQPPLNEGK